MRIDFDLQTEPGIQQFREFIDRATDIVVEHGGSISGEHGDGQSRGALLPKMFGPELMGAFREFKRLWDPDNKMNPGKLDRRASAARRFCGSAPTIIRARSRRFSDFPTTTDRWRTRRCAAWAWARAARKTTARCARATWRRAKRSTRTRGRAHLLWELLQGEVLEGGWQNEDVKDALDLCLSCKACKTECPTNVDLATYKAEFLAHYYEGRSRPLHAYAFGMIDRWARMASHTPRLANALGRFPLTAGIAKSLLHIAPERRLPEFATTTFRARAADLQRRGRDEARRGAGGAKAGMCYCGRTRSRIISSLRSQKRPTRYCRTRDSASRFFSVMCAAGGRSTTSACSTRRSSTLTQAMDALADEISAGTPIVVLEPSCASVFRDEAVNLMPDDPRTAKLKGQTMLLSEFLAQRAPDYAPATRQQKILVHMHCHHRAIFNMKDEVAVLNATGGEVKVLDSGCCGMAGPFGFEKKSYAVSQTLGERVLLPAVRAAEPGTIIVTDGFSCREQIAQNTGKRALHLAEVLAGRI